MSHRNGLLFDLDLENSIGAKWQRVGVETGLSSDTQIAGFLIQQYEAHSGRKPCCSQCHIPLSLYCPRCKALVSVTELPRWLETAAISHQTSDVVKDTASCINEFSLPVFKVESQSEQSKARESDLSSPPISSPSFTFLGSEDAGNVKDDDDIKDSKQNVVFRHDDSSNVNPTKCTAPSTRLRRGHFVHKSVNDNHGSDRIPKGSRRKRKPPLSSENLLDKQLIKADVLPFEPEDAVNISNQDLVSVFDQDMQNASSLVGNEVDMANIKLEPVVSLENDILAGPPRKGRKKKENVGRKKKENGQSVMPDCRCVCIVCGCSFPDRKRLKEHKLSKHPGDKPFRCSLCSSTFRKKKTLKCHMLSHSKEKPLLCTVCGKGFCYENSLRIHMRTHTEEKPYPCKLCDYTGISSSSLRRHELSHTSDRPFICEVCCKGFKSLPALKRHRLRHTEIKSFSCDICGAKFKMKDEVRGHKIAVHRTGRTASKTLFCPQCDFTTHLPTRLKQHLVSHSEERPFKCDLCPKSFRRKFHFDRHQQCHGGKTAYVCSICNASYNREDNLTAHLKKHSQAQSVVKTDEGSL